MKLLDSAPRTERYERSTLLTVAVLVMYTLMHRNFLAGALPPLARVLALAGGIAALLLTRSHRRPLFWIAATLFVGSQPALHPFSTDDHIFLLAYWCLALAIAPFCEDVEAATATSARSLLAAVFVFATLWKLVSPTYLNGSVFHYLLLGDPRLGRMTVLFHRASSAELLANYRALTNLKINALPEATLAPAAATRALGTLFTAMVLVGEAIVAVAFTLRAPRVAALRDPVMIGFLLITYLMAPVVLFGQILAVLGLAQAGSPRARIGYLLAMIWLLAWTHYLTLTA